MKISEYLKDKIIIILVNVMGIFALSEYLIIIGNAVPEVILIGIVWIIILVIYFVSGWYNRNKYFTELKRQAMDLEKPWLLPEILPFSFNACDTKYQELMRYIGKAALSQVNKTEDGQREYKEYIENWVHEIKTPITLLYLLIENNDIKEPLKKEIILELKRIENNVESALYYARLGTAYNDYLVKKVFLKEVITEAVKNNKVLLISSKIKVDIICDEDIVVYSDGKWILFILNQIIINSVKYSRENKPETSFIVTEGKHNVRLQVKDNGTGICAEDLPRIFEKGYTGKNGHNNTKSTGIGLYLVKEMCKKLDIEITASSDGKEYTDIVLLFKKKIFFN